MRQQLETVDEMPDLNGVEMIVSVLSAINGFAKGLMATIMAYLLTYIVPTQVMINGLIFFIIIDLICGSLVAISDGQAFEWKKAMRTVFKFILYPMAVLVAQMYETDFATVVPMTSVVAGTIGLFELKSIYTKMSILLGFNLVGMIWEKIKEIVDSKAKPKS